MTGDDSRLFDLLDPEWAEARKRMAEERGVVTPSVPQPLEAHPQPSEGQSYAVGSLPEEQPTRKRALLRDIGNVDQPGPSGPVPEGERQLEVGAVMPVTSDLPPVASLEQTDVIATVDPSESEAGKHTTETRLHAADEPAPSGLGPAAAATRVETSGSTVGGRTAVIAVPAELKDEESKAAKKRVTDAGLAARLATKGPGGTQRGLPTPAEALAHMQGGTPPREGAPEDDSPSPSPALGDSAAIENTTDGPRDQPDEPTSAWAERGGAVATQAEVAALKDALPSAALKERPVSEPPPSATDGVAGAPPDRRLMWVVAAALICLAVVLYFAWQERQPPASAPEQVGVPAPVDQVAPDAVDVTDADDATDVATTADAATDVASPKAPAPKSSPPAPRPPKPHVPEPLSPPTGSQPKAPEPKQVEPKSVPPLPSGVPTVGPVPD